MTWMSYGSYRRHMVNPYHSVDLLPLLKLGPLCLVLIRHR